MKDVTNHNCLLRIEAVNLKHFIGDTRDLSTIRGGGLMLLNSISSVENHLVTHFGKQEVETVGKGASIGLFKISGQSSDLVEEEVRRFLHQDPDYSFATFVVDTKDMKAESEFAQTREMLQARNRFRQLREGSFSVAHLQDPHASAPCEVEGRLPGSEGEYKGENTLLVSKSVKRRRDYGQKKKQQFYADLCPENGFQGSFAGSFEAIVDGIQNLENKMAVFYADGNSFGKLQTDCLSPSDSQNLDTTIRQKQTEFLQEILKWIDDTPAWKNADGEARFETLLWGGDEMMFVMPASRGWEFARRFFQFFQDFKWGDHQLTHTAALTWCHYRSPIDRIRNLLQYDMAEFAKEQSRERDQLVFVALESFDHLGNGFETAMKKRYDGALKPGDMILQDSDLGARLKAFGEIIETLHLCSEFPRSQLRRRVQRYLHEVEPDKDPFRNVSKEVKSKLQDLASIIPDEKRRWFLLEELWDYAKVDTTKSGL